MSKNSIPLLLLLAFSLSAHPATFSAGPALPDTLQAGVHQGPDLSETALAAVADEVRQYVERGLIVGGELLVMHRRQPVLHETFGYSDREDGVPWTKGTVANIKSMTKPVTGAAAQILIDRGQLGLDDPAAKYLPGFDTDAARAVTIRQMLSHRAGLPMGILTAKDEYETLKDIGNAVGARGPEFEPGSRFWYTDSGTDALGAIIEVASGMTLDTFVQQELLDPLGMSETFYYLNDEDPRRLNIASLYVWASDRWERALNPDEGAYYPFAWGAQSLYSTPLDYAKFLAMWMDGGLVGRRRILSEAAVARSLRSTGEMTMMGSTTRQPTTFKGIEVHYGQMAMLHLPVGSTGAEPARIVGHSGADGTHAWAWPEHDLMILFFTRSRGTAVRLRFEEAVDRLLIAPEAYQDAAGVPEELAPFIGTYIADWTTHMKEQFVVHVKNEHLWIDVPGQTHFELLPASEAGQWTFALAPELGAWFERDAKGEVNCLRIKQGPLIHEAPRMDTPHAIEVRAANRADPGALAKYLGAYDDPDSDQNVRVFIDGDYVALEGRLGVAHLWKHPLRDVWIMRENPVVTITFQEDAGAVVSLTFDVTTTGAKTVFPRIRRLKDYSAASELP